MKQAVKSAGTSRNLAARRKAKSLIIREKTDFYHAIIRIPVNLYQFKLVIFLKIFINETIKSKESESDNAGFF